MSSILLDYVREQQRLGAAPAALSRAQALEDEAWDYKARVVALLHRPPSAPDPPSHVTGLHHSVDVSAADRGGATNASLTKTWPPQRPSIVEPTALEAQLRHEASARQTMLRDRLLTAGLKRQDFPAAFAHEMDALPADAALTQIERYYSEGRHIPRRRALLAFRSDAEATAGPSAESIRRQRLSIRRDTTLPRAQPPAPYSQAHYLHLAFGADPEDTVEDVACLEDSSRPHAPYHVPGPRAPTPNVSVGSNRPKWAATNVVKDTAKTAPEKEETGSSEEAPVSPRSPRRHEERAQHRRAVDFPFVVRKHGPGPTPRRASATKLRHPKPPPPKYLPRNVEHAGPTKVPPPPALSPRGMAPEVVSPRRPQMAAQAPRAAATPRGVVVVRPVARATAPLPGLHSVALTPRARRRSGEASALLAPQVSDPDEAPVEAAVTAPTLSEALESPCPVRWLFSHVPSPPGGEQTAVDENATDATPAVAAPVLQALCEKVSCCGDVAGLTLFGDKNTPARASPLDHVPLHGCIDFSATVVSLDADGLATVGTASAGTGADICTPPPPANVAKETVATVETPTGESGRKRTVQDGAQLPVTKSDQALPAPCEDVSAAATTADNAKHAPTSKPQRNLDPGLDAELTPALRLEARGVTFDLRPTVVTSAEPHASLALPRLEAAQDGGSTALPLEGVAVPVAIVDASVSTSVAALRARAVSTPTTAPVAFTAERMRSLHHRLWAEHASTSALGHRSVVARPRSEAEAVPQTDLGRAVPGADQHRHRLRSSGPQAFPPMPNRSFVALSQLPALLTAPGEAKGQEPFPLSGAATADGSVGPPSDAVWARVCDRGVRTIGAVGADPVITSFAAKSALQRTATARAIATARGGQPHDVRPDYMPTPAPPPPPPPPPVPVVPRQPSTARAPRKSVAGSIVFEATLRGRTHGRTTAGSALARRATAAARSVESQGAVLTRRARKGHTARLFGSPADRFASLLGLDACPPQPLGPNPLRSVVSASAEQHAPLTDERTVLTDTTAAVDAPLDDALADAKRCCAVSFQRMT